MVRAQAVSPRGERGRKEEGRERDLARGLSIIVASGLGRLRRPKYIPWYTGCKIFF